MYGKQTETAIAAMSRLAEVFVDADVRLSTIEIAASRGLQAPSVAKVLATLSQAGLVKGTPGPGGGYVLGRPPSEIRLLDVFKLFERENTSSTCPFGGGVCGQGDPCPMHHRLVRVQSVIDELLQTTTFDIFLRNGGLQAGCADAVVREVTLTPMQRRASFRAYKPKGRGAQ